MLTSHASQKGKRQKKISKIHRNFRKIYCDPHDQYAHFPRFPKGKNAVKFTEISEEKNYNSRNHITILKYDPK